ncbi:MAG: M16 family metallopeptidase [Pyrinomonadaceae bacterium]
MIKLKVESRFILKLFVAALLSLSVATQTVSAQQETIPPPSAPRPAIFPRPVEKTLRNGLRVVVIEKKDAPLVAAQLLIKNGGEVDPSRLAGLAQMTAELLTKGTMKRSAPQIAEAIEALGGSLDSGAGWDASSASFEVMATKVAPALEILSDVVRHPAFKDEEIERLRQQTLDEVSVAFRQPGTLARAVASRVVFGNAPYGHPLSGTPESLARIKRDDIVQLHSTYYRPDNAILVIGGGIRPEAAFQLAEKLFGDWKGTATAPSQSNVGVKENAGNVNAQTRVIVVDKPDAGQAAVVLARTGLTRVDTDYFRALVANSVLGGGYSARLNQEIRIKRGLSYGASSSISARRDVGPFTAATQTKNESGAVVASLLLGELNRLSGEPVSDVELTPRKAVLTGNFSRGLETTSGLVSQIGLIALYGLSLDSINRYIGDVQAISSSDVQRFAGSRLNAKGTGIVIVGDAKQFLTELRKQFPNVEVIPESDVDLNSASLRRANSKNTAKP